MADVEMPQLGETVTEGTITRWFKKVGERVEVDEVLFEVSTDKVDSEVPSPAAGYVTEILVAEGETVEVGERLAVLSESAAGEPGSSDPDSAPEPIRPEASPDSVPEPIRPEASPVPAAGPAPVPPSAPPPATATPLPTAAVGLLLSPVVRRLIAKHGLDPASIAGTGVGGRITRADVLAVIDAGGGTAPPPAGAGAPTAAAAPAPTQAGPGEDTVVPLSNIRLRTGEHMVSSKATSPHVLTAMEVDFEGVDRVRRAHRSAWKEEEGFSLTYLPFVIRAVVDAIAAYPHINATIDGGDLVVRQSVDIGIAVDMNFEGLLAPVVRAAGEKRLRALAREVVDLAERARAKKLSADEIAGGTFTITNPGQYGTLMQFPIINQPQVAILSTDGVSRKPVVVTNRDGSEGIAIHSVGVLALAWDHRAFDGAYAAAFLADLRDTIGQRDWEAEL